MNTKRMLLPLLLASTWFVLLETTCFAEEARVWTSSQGGRQFTGVLIGVEGESISIRRASDNAVFQVNRTDLVPEDWEWIVQRTAKPGPEESAEDLSELIADLPASTGTPAVGVILIEDGKTRGIGVAGVRKSGSDVPVERGDKWHLGSCTKSMTATLAATFVEDGTLTWETTVSDILGKEMKIREEYETVTLGMLLANRSGITGERPEGIYQGIDIESQATELGDRELLEQRGDYVETVLNLEPSSAPNTRYEYSNAGFVVAGAMLEQVAGKPWEKLLQERVFEPLGMVNSGFGNAAHEDTSHPTQPWPHKDNATPCEPGPWDDNPWVIGPAGTVHGSLGDIARYLIMHATRETGPVIEKTEIFEFLHTAVPDNNNYARGWIVARAGWTGGPAVSHNGSNTMNHCSFWVAPDRKAAVAAFTNSDEKGSEVCRMAIRLVVEKYLE